MNLAKGTKDRLVLAAVMIGPMVGVLGFRGGAGVQPRSSGAATSPMPATTATDLAPGPAMNAAQKAAAAYLTARPVAVATRSPMRHTAAPAAAPVAADADARVEPEDVPADAPSLTLSTIYSSSTNVAAIINGRVYRAGERVAKDWTVREIDARAMSVVIEGPRGKTIRLSQPRAN